MVTQSHDLTLAELIKATHQRRGQLDYVYFLKEILGHDCKYTRDPGVAQYLGEFGQELLDWFNTRKKQTVPRKAMIVVPRNTFKTSGISQSAPVYLSTLDPNLSMGVMSWSNDLASDIAGATRQNFVGDADSNILAEVYNPFHAPDSKRHWSGDHFTIDQRTVAKRDPTVSTYCVSQGVVGRHFDAFFFDDPTSDKKMENDREWNNKVWNTWIGLKAALNPDSFVAVIMTRYHDADLAGRIIAEEIEPRVKSHFGGKLPDDWSREDFKALEKYGSLAGWKIIMREAVSDVGTEQETHNFPTIWSPELVNDIRSGDVDLDDFESDSGAELFFWYQLQNKPFKRTDNPIKELHIKTAVGSPEPWSLDEAPRVGFVDIFCDFAFKSADAYMKQSGDYTVAHVCVPRDGFVWRVNGYRGKPTQDMFGDELIRLATWAKNELGARVRFVTFDKTTGQGSGDKSMETWIQNLFRRYPSLNTPTIKPVPRTQKKEALILSTVWAWQEGWVRLCKEAPGVDELIYQVSRIGQTRHDDDIDAFSTAFLPDFYKQQARVEVAGVNDFNWVPAVPGWNSQDFDDPWLKDGWVTV